ALEILEHDVARLETERGLARVTEAFAGQIHLAFGADDRGVDGQVVTLGAARETPEHVQRINGAHGRRGSALRRGRGRLGGGGAGATPFFFSWVAYCCS